MSISTATVSRSWVFDMSSAAIRAIKATPEEDFESWLDCAINANHCCHFWTNDRLKWSSANSDVVSLPSFDFKRIFGKLPQRNLACSLVSISGPTDEDLHFHTSDVIGLVTKGRGRLRHIEAGKCQATDVVVGDICVIPSRVLHLFDTEPGGLIEYIALEASSHEIDYQKHWSASEL